MGSGVGLLVTGGGVGVGLGVSFTFCSFLKYGLACLGSPPLSVKRRPELQAHCESSAQLPEPSEQVPGNSNVGSLVGAAVGLAVGIFCL